jgi:glycine C-acetyltransferase
MDGVVAPLDKICDLADKYDAMVMIDECHATFIGATGKGTLEAKGVRESRYYNWNSGKALGGAGGYTTAKRSY